jgi:hypothetical protein
MYRPQRAGTSRRAFQAVGTASPKALCRNVREIDSWSKVLRGAVVRIRLNG